MEFIDADLGTQPAGASVTVRLSGTEANVMLVDQANFQHYKAARDYAYVGGHYKRSPVRLTVPHRGHRHAVVDLGGFLGRVNASFEVTPA